MISTDAPVKSGDTSWIQDRSISLMEIADLLLWKHIPYTSVLPLIPR